MTAPLTSDDAAYPFGQENPDGPTQASVHDGPGEGGVSDRTLATLAGGETPVIGARRIDHANATDYGFGALGIEYVLLTAGGELIPDVAGLVAIGVLDNDTPGGTADGDKIDAATMAIATAPTHGAAAVWQGDIWYAPVAGYSGDDSLGYTIDNDDGETSSEATVAIGVLHAVSGILRTVVTAAPRGGTSFVDPGAALDRIATDDSLADASAELPADADLVVQAVEIVTQPAYGTATVVGRTARYDAPADYSGRTAFTWRALVNGLWSDPGVVNVRVGRPVLRPGARRRGRGLLPISGLPPTRAKPIRAVIDFAVTDYLTPVTISPLANDFGDDLEIQSVETPPHGSIEDNGDGTLTYTPNSGFSGVDRFAYTATNGVLASTALINVFVAPPALTAADDAATTGPATPVVIPVLDNDSGTGLFVAAVSDPPHGSAAITDVDQTVTYTPDGGWAGDDTFTYTVEDAAGNQRTAFIRVRTDPDPIIVRADVGTTTTTTPVEISVLANDEGDGLFVASVTEPDHGSVDITGGGTTVTYTADADFIGEDSFTYTAEDDAGQTASAAVIVRVLATPNPPVIARPDAATTAVNTPVEISVLANDEGTGLTVTSVSRTPLPGADVGGSEVQGDLEITSGDTKITFTPYETFAGETTFSYTCSDGVDSSSANVVVTVPYPAIDAQNDAAVAVQGEDTPIDVLANDTVYGDAAVVAPQAIAAKPRAITVPRNGSTIVDPRDVCFGSGLTVSAVGTPSHGTATKNAAGTRITYTPSTGYTGSDSFTYTITDGIATHASVINCTVEIVETVTANDDDVATAYETAVLVPVLDNDSGSDALIVAAVGTPSNGTAAIVDDQSVRYTPRPGYSGDDSFNYTARLATGAAFDSAVVRVTVSGSSSFVKVATPYWTTLPGSSIIVPGSWNEQAENNFNPGPGKAVDLREKVGRNHIKDVQGRVTLVNLTAAAGAGVFGFKCRGMQPRTLPWQAMKFGSHGEFQTGSLAADKSWDDKHLKIKGSINGTVYAEDFASYDSMDGIDTGDTGNHDYKLVLRRFYGRGNRDDLIQNDQLKEVEAEDFLVDGCHFFCSVRPGGSLTSTKNITFRNALIRLGRNRYYGNWGGGGTASWNQNALYKGYWTDPANIGLPTLSSGADGYGHNQFIKDSAGFQGKVFMTDCLLFMEGVPLGGPATISLPAGTYTRVVLIYAGQTPVNFDLPSGVTLITDRSAGWNLWMTERQKWLVAHGDNTGTGDDFPFLHR